MATAVREQASATTLMAQQMANEMEMEMATGMEMST